jgi:ketosteroid isomerase-like protein
VSEERNREAVKHLWAVFDAFEFARAAEVLSPDFVCEWPQSRERIRGAADYIALNEGYPGRWRCRLHRLLVDGDRAASLVEVTDGSTTVWASSFYELRDGCIERAVEYWSTPFEPRPGREQWVERF